jgi:hypothetical protein
MLPGTILLPEDRPFVKRRAVCPGGYIGANSPLEHAQVPEQRTMSEDLLTGIRADSVLTP